jgi:catechol 2,3-dioxygenase-like lactoylglutathione lyase family enzyme
MPRSRLSDSHEAFGSSPHAAQRTPVAATQFAVTFETGEVASMKLGAFSISLAVRDIHASKAFYEKLGFSAFGGNIDQNWIILKNGDHLVGLFQGMLEKNTLTFNPGWDQNAARVEGFADVREIQRELKQQGLSLEAEADPSTSGPGHLMVIDPDGNPILIDQHL